MHTPKLPPHGKKAGRGISLIVVLIMLVIIGITAATAMRTATSEQRATNNLRMEGTAQQYAEAALRFCETQIMSVVDASRPAALQTANIPVITAAPYAWETASNWTGSPVFLYTLQASQVSDANTPVPPTLPQCMAELQTMGPSGATFTQTVITARGFSPDYVADVSGNTTQGAVVWLQSIVNGI